MVKAIQKRKGWKLKKNFIVFYDLLLSSYWKFVQNCNDSIPVIMTKRERSKSKYEQFFISIYCSFSSVNSCTLLIILIFDEIDRVLDKVFIIDKVVATVD